MRSEVVVLGLSRPEARVIFPDRGPRHVSSCPVRDRTRVPCIAKWILNRWTGEALTQFYERLVREMIMILRPEREIIETPSHPGREVRMFRSPEVLSENSAYPSSCVSKCL